MLASLAYGFYPTWSIGPLVIFIFTFLLICFILFSRSSTRGSIGYSALVGALAGLIYNIIITITFNTSPTLAIASAAPSSYVFYGIYISFTFVPGLIAFHGISKANGNTISKFIVYFGYLWSFIIIVIGLAVTIYIAVKINDLDDLYNNTLAGGNSLSHMVNLILFMYYSPWAFVAAYLVLVTANIGHLLPGKARNSLLAYSALNILSILVFTIVSNASSNFDSMHGLLSTIYAVTFIFCDIPVATALIIATLYGYLWASSREARIEDKLEIPESTNSAEANV